MTEAAKQTAGDGSGIVVGVDGSESSLVALRWGLRQARLTGSAVRAVITWQPTIVYGGIAPVEPRGYAPVEDDGYAETAAQVLAEAVHKTLADEADEPKIEIKQQVVHGNAVEVLLKTSVGADLLVLGSRGHGGFVGALLGSVSQHCVQHATCPVVIVRAAVR